MSDATVYFVPYLDGDWLGYGPLDADINYGLLPPDENEILGNLETAVPFMAECVGGKFVFGAHTGTYCREAFYSERALAFYRQFAANGGEIAVHPHEERSPPATTSPIWSTCGSSSPGTESAWSTPGSRRPRSASL